jgi:hypothetical protein
VFLAKVYFGLFYDVDREASPDARLEAETSPEITAAALQGFIAGLRSTEIPSAIMIGEAHAESKGYELGYVILAGMDILAARSIADVLALPQRTLECALPFHYVNLTERQRTWITSLISALPEFVADVLAAFWRPQLARESTNIPALYELAHEAIMEPVARRVSLDLLSQFPSAPEANLELLLHAALCHAEPSDFLVLARHVLAGNASLNVENRTLWCATAFILNSSEFKEQLAQHIGGSAEQAARLLQFVCPSLGVKRDIQYPLPSDAVAFLVAITGRIFQPQDLGGGGWLGLHSRGEASSSVRSLIFRLGKDRTREAAEALAELHDDSGLMAWRPDIAYIREDQARQRRESAFRYPSVGEVIETLNQGRPANEADLQALVSSHLYALRAELRDGPTDGWKAMWNVDPHEKPMVPRPENNCRDRLLEHLKLRLARLDVATEREGDYAEHKRADIKAIFGALNLPVEIKRHNHEDLWTAPVQQLKKLYTRDPGTAGRGIYLVLWFGIEVAPIPVPPDEIARPQTPSELEAALLQVLPASDREAIEIIVFDCAPRERDRRTVEAGQATQAQP